MTAFFYKLFQGPCDTALGARVRDAVSRDYDEQLSRAGVRADSDVALGQELLSAFKDRPIETGSAEHDLVIGQAPVQLRTSEVVRDFITAPSLIDTLGSFLGRKFFFHFAPVTRCILPGNSFALVPAHSDYSYNAHYRRADGSGMVADFFTAWIPLVEITDTCRGIEIFDREPLVYQPNAAVDGLWFTPPQTTTEPARIRAKPGDMLIFNPAVIHQSGDNTSSARRISMEVRFFPETTRTSKHYFDPISKTLYAPGTGPNAL